MNYNIMAVSDIHWGVVDPDIHEDRLQYLFMFLEMYHVDLLVICGDFWDEKEPLNASPALKGINWFHRLKDKAIETGVKAMRLFKGTVYHDNDQLEAFRNLEDDMGFFKLFNYTTSEETLPGLHCIYCPDELLTNDEYMDAYSDIILKGHDIGFFHGSFDVVFSNMIEMHQDKLTRNVVYQYNFWETVVRGPLIAGHWHDGKQYDHLYYNGSPDRWAFKEDNPKGFGFICYDTDTCKYFYKKITNCIAPEYITYEIYTNVATSIQAYNFLIEEVNRKLESYNEDSYRIVKIRILIYVNNDSMDNETHINSLKHYYINDKRVKILVKDKMKDKKKNEESVKHQDSTKKYGFIFDKNNKPAQIIQQYILLTRGEDIPIYIIEEKVSKYMKEMAPQG